MSRETLCRIAAVGVLVGLAIGLACAPSGHRRHQLTVAETDASGMHAVHSDRLEEIMATIGTQLPRIWPQEVQQEREAEAREVRSSRFAEIRDVAGQLEQSARQLPGLVTDAGLDEAEMQAFSQLARRMAEHSAGLSRAGAAGDTDGVRQAMSQVVATCNECHSKFRAQAGPLPQ